MPEERRILRFSFAERAIHWLSALSFLYAGLSGLALWTPGLYWLSIPLGGGEMVRGWHPWGGIVFSLFLGTMFRAWARQMLLSREDRTWLRGAHRYAVHDESGLPPPGRFNGGQKMLFWIQALCCLLLLLSGLVLWFPESTSQSLRLVAIMIHPPAALISILFIIVHIYMGTAAVPGSFRAMIHGWVSERWAASHHPRWHQKISER